MKPSLVRKAPASTMPIANNWRAGLAGATPGRRNAVVGLTCQI
jgi:hypothetical protein